MTNKKGVSPLLATVLLVALAVTMATIVSTFLIKKTQEFNPDQLAQQSLYCESVSVGYNVPDALKDQLGIYHEGADDPLNQGKKISGKGVAFLYPINLINRGAFSIQYFIVNAPGLESKRNTNSDNQDQITVLKPGKSPDNEYTTMIQVNEDYKKSTEIAIIPVIKDLEKNQLVQCTDRQLIIDYDKLCKDVTPDAYELAKSCRYFPAGAG